MSDYDPKERASTYSRESFRPAVKADRLAFMDMVEPYVEELRSFGGSMVPSFKTFNTYGRLFDAYVDGSLLGVAQLFEPDDVPQGFLLVGEDFSTKNMDYDGGPVGIFWGIYVNPSYRMKGVARPLQMSGWDYMRDNGVSKIQGQVLAGNDAGLAQAKRMGGVVLSYIMSIDTSSLDDWKW